MSNNISKPMVKEITTLHNLLNNYHQIHFYSGSKQFMFYGLDGNNLQMLVVPVTADLLASLSHICKDLLQ